MGGGQCSTQGHPLLFHAAILFQEVDVELLRRINSPAALFAASVQLGLVPVG